MEILGRENILYEKQNYTDDVITKVSCAERKEMSREERKKFQKMLTTKRSKVILKLKIPGDANYINWKIKNKAKTT